ncbi:hypothetical protein Leryth_024655, partial [Lithospermum erythrorhizon]
YKYAVFIYDVIIQEFIILLILPYRNSNHDVPVRRVVIHLPDIEINAPDDVDHDTYSISWLFDDNASSNAQKYTNIEEPTRKLEEGGGSDLHPNWNLSETYLFLLKTDESNILICAIDTSNGSLHEVTGHQLPSPNCYVDYAMIGDKIYFVFGGCDETASCKIETLNLTTMKWNSLEDNVPIIENSPNPRPKLLAFHGNLFSVFNSSNILNDIPPHFKALATEADIPMWEEIPLFDTFEKKGYHLIFEENSVIYLMFDDKARLNMKTRTFELYPGELSFLTDSTSRCHPQNSCIVDKIWIEFVFSADLQNNQQKPNLYIRKLDQLLRMIGLSSHLGGFCLSQH